MLVSGTGSNLQAIIDACASDRLKAEVVVVVSNNPDAYALTRAADSGIETIVRPHQGIDRAVYDTELAFTVANFSPDLVVLAGWNRILTTYFVSHHTAINVHPAKPGAFPGLHAIERAYEAWQNGDIDHGGVMVHFVPDEGIDDGPTIGWQSVPFEQGDTLASFEARVHKVEHTLLVDSIAKVIG